MNSQEILARLRENEPALRRRGVRHAALFGSRTRGDHCADSDYDLSVSIRNHGSLSDELHRLAAISTDILLDTGAVISAKPFLAGGYRERTGFRRDLRRDGIDL
ncbi:MAG: nucleotidyltransferase family protein [Stellaceae bacterium]